jgi:NarL family two-component system response regulator LiaR
LPDIRVLVADDHAVVREGLRTFLKLQKGIEVIGEAADGEEAVDEARRRAPDVVLMDLVMPKLDGV